MEELEFRPVYQQISDQLKQRIVSGEIASGTMLPSEDILSKQFKVSKPTIRKSLEILRKQRIISKQNGRGTFVIYETENIHRVQKIGIYGFNQNHNNSYQSLLFAGLSHEIHKLKSAELVMLLKKEDLNESSLDGVILISPSASEIKDIIKTPVLSIPHVILSASGSILKRHSFNFIDSNNVQGAYDAVTHLIKQGHKKIIYLGGRADYFNCIDRLKGYKKALTDNGLPVDPSLIYEVRHRVGEEANAFMQTLFEKKTDFSAVFAGGLGLALQIVAFLKEKKLRIPDDISVIGFDDFETAILMAPPLTTVRQPIFEIGRQAAEMLIDQLHGEKLKSGQIILKTELIVRKSTRKIS